MSNDILGTGPARAVATGRDRLLSQDFWGGVILTVFAVAAIWEALHLPETQDELGASFFPFWIGVLIAIFAALLFVGAWRGKSLLAERPAWRPFVFSFASLLSFAVLLPIVGGVISMIAVVTLAALGEPGRTLREIVMLNIIVIVPLWLIFVVGLSVQIPLF